MTATATQSTLREATAAYLAEAFRSIRERAGSVEAYLADLGVDARAAARLRGAR